MATAAVTQSIWQRASAKACRLPVLATGCFKPLRCTAVGFSTEARWLEKRQSFDEMSGRERFSMAAMRERQAVPSVLDYLGRPDKAESDLSFEIRSLGTSRQWEQALVLFSAVQEPGPHVLYAMLQAYAKSFQIERAWQVFNSWNSRPVPAYNLMIAMLSRSKRVTDCENLLQELKARGMEPTAVTYTSMMTAYGTAGNSEAVLRLFSEMEAKGLAITEVEYGSAMAACGRSADYANASELLAKMDANRVEPHIGHFTSLIMACVQKRDGSTARSVWNDMKQRGLKPDVVAYTCLASCFEGSEAWQNVQELRVEMEAAGIKPHVFFYNEMLRAATEGADEEAFQRVLREMDERSVARNSRTEIRITRQQRQQEAARRGEFGAAHRRPSSGFEAPLPPGWQQTMDPSSGRFYYWREADPSGSVTWERPSN
eukprot:TRINITY_DN7662_c0_g1_i2.p1 TRINITY_DN7662_c0_g1~~TRINITY_DN7662_c0_g1_i2.p1  ORF type:complete len:429 (-),score=68.86 TRINITY_DN7662_c0_g1_i2:189-1475(-)